MTRAGGAGSEAPLGARIRERLSRKHRGKGHGVPCRELAEALDASPREVRSAITELRLAGVPVCGHPRTGYFLARTAAELNETCDFLRNRALHSLQLEARLRKVPLQRLVGQLSLNLFEDAR
jgi:biotin operon repressor